MNEQFLTLRGKSLLQTSDVIVHDRLLDSRLLQDVRLDAEIIDVGKKSGRHIHSQEEIERILIDKAREGKQVVRLKGGDPYIFGRGAEEALALAAADIPFELVPGVTSATAVPGLSGIPLSHRGLSSFFVVATGHEDPDKGCRSVDWRALARLGGTLVVLMGRERIHHITRELIEGGMDPDTPSAMVSHSARSGSRRLVCPVIALANRADEEKIESPAVIVIGNVVSLCERLQPPKDLPLAGHRFVLVCTSEGAPGLAQPLVELGADVVEHPTIQIHPLRSGLASSAFRELSSFSWILFRSKRTVAFFFSFLWEQGLDLRAIGSARLAAIGPSTGQALMDRGLRADLVPPRFTSESLLAELVAQGIQGQRVLVPGGDQADPHLTEGLRHAEAMVTQVTFYASKCPEHLSPLPWPSSQVSAYLLTSGSGARNMLRFLDVPAREIRSICIGPVTANTAESLGFSVLAVAKDHTYQGLANTVIHYFSSSSGSQYHV